MHFGIAAGGSAPGPSLSLYSLLAHRVVVGLPFVAVGAEEAALGHLGDEDVLDLVERRGVGMPEGFYGRCHAPTTCLWGHPRPAVVYDHLAWNKPPEAPVQTELSMAEYEEEEEQGFSTEPAPLGYIESKCQRVTVRCCGAGCFVFLGMLTLAWITHAIPVADADAPSFARSLIWMSLAHHTDTWKDWCKTNAECRANNWEYLGVVPDPTPQFGDGNGNF